MTADDAADLHAAYRHPDAMRYWDTPPHRDNEETGGMLARALAPDTACWWAICLRGEDRVIGNVGYLGNAGTPGMGYLLHPDHWGQGYMAEAVHAALDFGFEELGLDRVELWINHDNLASLRVAQKAGFTRRGRLRQKYRHHTVSHDKEVYGIDMDEWRQLRAGRRVTPPTRSHCDFYSVQPVLAVHDVQATAEWYRDRLGFAIDFLYGDPPTHGGVSRGRWTPETVRIQLSQIEPETALQPTIALYIFTGPDIEALYAQYRDNGVGIRREVASQPWGMREFEIEDCNGYALRFGVPG